MTNIPIKLSLLLGLLCILVVFHSVITTTKSTTFTVDGKSINAVLYVNFNDRALGLYKRGDLETDFQVGQEGYHDTVHGPDWNSTFIVNDPAGNTGRGRVLEVKHFAGKAGSGNTAGGMRFRADFPAADE